MLHTQHIKSRSSIQNGQRQTPYDKRVYVDKDELTELRTLKDTALLHYLERIQHPMPGDGNSTAIGRGIEFSEIRAYQPGDDIRAIDWRLSARTGSTYSRVYTEDRERQLYLLLDQRAPMFFGSHRQFKSVLAAKLAAQLAWSALDAGYRIGGCVVAEGCYRIRSQRTRSSVMQLLSTICDQNHSLSVSTQSTVALSDAIAQSISDTSGGTRMVIVSDFHDLDDAAVAILLHTARVRRWLLIGIFDPIERQLPRSRLVGISNGLRHVKARLTRQVAQHWDQITSEHQQRINDVAEQMGSHISWVSTADSLADTLAAIQPAQSREPQHGRA